MGRPVNKRYFGATGNDAQPTIPARFYDGSATVEGYIVAQKGTNKFKVSDGTTTIIGRLVNDLSPTGSNEISLVGIAEGSTPVVLRKVFNRTALDWDNNRYTWAVDDDSTQSIMVLTAK